MYIVIEMEEETMEKMDQMMKSVLIVIDPRIADYLPILRPFFSKQRNRAMDVRREQIDFLIQFIEKHREMLRNSGFNKSTILFYYPDTLFDPTVEGRKSGPSNPKLLTLYSEFLKGGTDTTRTAIEWGIAQLIANPDVQLKLYDEIKSTVGDRKVEESDVEKMEYLQAAVKELLQKLRPTYFSLTHAVTEPTTPAGYDITWKEKMIEGGEELKR